MSVPSNRSQRPCRSCRGFLCHTLKTTHPRGARFRVARTPLDEDSGENGIFYHQVGRKPHSDNPGGLNESTQHLLKVFFYGPRRLISFAGANSTKSKALFRV